MRMVWQHLEAVDRKIRGPAVGISPLAGVQLGVHSEQVEEELRGPRCDLEFDLMPFQIAAQRK